MAHVTRRDLALAAGLAGAGLATVAAAQPASPGGPMPPSTPRVGTGGVQDGRVTMPPTAAPSEGGGSLPNPDPVNRRVGMAVVGLGHLTLEEILPGLGDCKHVRLTALVSGDREKARTVAAQYGVPETHLYDYANYDRLRDNPDVDFVYIVLPNSMHLEYTLRAAQAGKHVLCEKPMATTSADAERMIAACRDANRLLMIAYRLQYEPHHRALIALARGGEHGPVRLIEAVNGQNQGREAQWRHIRGLAGGGSLPDVGIYCLNAARYVTGEEPVEITAQINRPKGDPRFAEIEDLCTFTLCFPSGAVANCSTGYSFHDSRQMRVMMPDAWAELSPAFSYQGLELRLGRKVGGANAVDQRRFSEKTSQFAREMDHFAECVRANRRPHTPGEEGLQDMRLIEAIYRAAEGGSPVRLPEVQGRDTTRGPAPQEQG